MAVSRFASRYHGRLPIYSVVSESRSTVGHKIKKSAANSLQTRAQPRAQTRVVRISRISYFVMHLRMERHAPEPRTRSSTTELRANLQPRQSPALPNQMAAQHLPEHQRQNKVEDLLVVASNSSNSMRAVDPQFPSNEGFESFGTLFLGVDNDTAAAYNRRPRL